MSSRTRRHRGDWSPDGPERLDRLLLEHQPRQLAGGIERRDRLGLGDGRRNERIPSSASATTMAQSAVCPSGTIGLVPVTTHPEPFRRARARTVVSGWPCPCSCRATVPRCRPEASSANRWSAPRARAARVAMTEDEKKGPGSGTLPICSRMMHISSSPAPSPGTSRPVQPSATNRSHSSAVMPEGSSASWRRVSPHLPHRPPGHVLQGELFGVEREIHSPPPEWRR